MTGTLTDGSLKVDDELQLLPQNRQVRIRALQNHYEECLIYLQEVDVL